MWKFVKEVQERLAPAYQQNWTVRLLQGAGVLTMERNGMEEYIEVSGNEDDITATAKQFFGGEECFLAPGHMVWEFSKPLTNDASFGISVVADGADALPAAVDRSADNFDRTLYANVLTNTMTAQGQQVDIDKLYQAVNEAQDAIRELASVLGLPELESALAEWLADNYRYCAIQEKPGYYEEGLYVDYREEPLSCHQLAEMLKSDNPGNNFMETVSEWWQEARFDAEDNLLSSVVTAMEKKWDRELDDVAKECIAEYLNEHFYFNEPYDFYLDSKVPVVVSLDTGDGNYDFVLNCCHVPHYNADDDPFDDRASLVWLAQQQGYTKDQLEQAIRRYSEGEETPNEDTFLGSAYSEIANSSSHMGMVVFLVKMTARQVFALEALSRLTEDGAKDVGHITLGRNTECGIFDPWSGAGGCLAIRLEKDVEIPINIIRHAWPDGGDGYGVMNVYGANSDIFRDTLKGIDFSGKLWQRVVELVP